MAQIFKLSEYRKRILAGRSPVAVRSNHDASPRKPRPQPNDGAGRQEPEPPPEPLGEHEAPWVR
jgi:hypothetical protein